MIDPVSAKRIHKNDSQRLLRALEIFYLSGKTVTQLTDEHNRYNLPYNIFQFAIMPPNKEWLNKKIEIRIQKMMASGFQEEVENLFHRGDLHINLPAIRSIGYRQMWEYLEYKTSYKEMLFKMITATKRLAKHQLTWLKKWNNLHKLYALDRQSLIKDILYTLKEHLN